MLYLRRTPADEPLETVYVQLHDTEYVKRHNCHTVVESSCNVMAYGDAREGK
jgi:hypothetical protein